MAKKATSVPRPHPTVGCCGIDCGLCPQHWSAGASRCPGCGGPGFREAHPSCSIITCCVTREGQETCATCPRYPCEKIAGWDAADSFVTHVNCLKTLDAIKARGIEAHVDQQRRRMEILGKLLDTCNDGRSKSLYCLATTLLSLEGLEGVLAGAARVCDTDPDVKRRAAIVKQAINQQAAREGQPLKLRKGA